MYWIKSSGSKLHPTRSDTEIEVIEMDEMHSYVGNKKTTVGYGLLLIDMGKDSFISLLVIDHQKQENNYGKASKIKM